MLIYRYYFRSSQWSTGGHRSPRGAAAWCSARRCASFTSWMRRALSSWSSHGSIRALGNKANSRDDVLIFLQQYKRSISEYKCINVTVYNIKPQKMQKKSCLSNPKLMVYIEPFLGLFRGNCKGTKYLALLSQGIDDRG